MALQSAKNVQALPAQEPLLYQMHARTFNALIHDAKRTKMKCPCHSRAQPFVLSVGYKPPYLVTSAPSILKMCQPQHCFPFAFLGSASLLSSNSSSTDAATLCTVPAGPHFSYWKWTHCNLWLNIQRHKRLFERACEVTILRHYDESYVLLQPLNLDKSQTFYWLQGRLPFVLVFDRL